MKTLLWLLSFIIFDEEIDCEIPAKKKCMVTSQSYENFNYVLEVPVPQLSKSPVRKKRQALSNNIFKKYCFNDIKFTCWSCEMNILNGEVMYCCDDKQFHKHCMNNIINLSKNKM